MDIPTVKRSLYCATALLGCILASPAILCAADFPQGKREKGKRDNLPVFGHSDG